MSEDQVKEVKKQAKIKRKARKAKEKREIIQKLLSTKQKRPFSEVAKAQDEIQNNEYKPRNLFDTPIVRYVNSSIGGNYLVIPNDVTNINKFFGVEQ